MEIRGRKKKSGLVHMHHSVEKRVGGNILTSVDASWDYKEPRESCLGSSRYFGREEQCHSSAG